MAAAGAAVGASMAAIQGGNILMGALTGGIAGGLAFAGGAIAGPYGIIAAGAASGAINAAIMGGDPLQGAWMGGLTAAVAVGVNSLTAGILEGVKDPLLRTIIQNGAGIGAGALTGGIGAELTGGDFMTGALYGLSSAAIQTAAYTLINTTAHYGFRRGRALIEYETASGKHYKEFMNAMELKTHLEQITGMQELDPIVNFKFGGHGNVTTLGFGVDQLSYFNGDLFVETNTNSFTITDTFKKAFAPNATIELRGCNTFGGKVNYSIAAGIQKMLPSAEVYGHTFFALSLHVFGSTASTTYPPGDFVRVKDVYTDFNKIK